ncbi:MAG: hypothetical protein ACREQ5_41255, partial [Candidatus Dormibacteria bacterium]
MAIATMADTLVPSRNVGVLVKAELTNLLYHNTRSTHLAGLIVAVLLAALFWDTPINRVILLAWLACMVVVELCRSLLNRSFRHRRIEIIRAPDWERHFLTGNLLIAFGWGLAGVLLFPAGDVANQMFLTVVIMAACAVTMPALAPCLKGYVVFLFMAALPLIARLVFTFGGIQLAAAGLA